MSAALKPVESSNIKAVGYDAATHTMQVQFASGTYTHSDVSQQQYDAFMAAPSKGKFYHANFRFKHNARKV